MLTYHLVTDDGYESDIEAASLQDAVRIASRAILDAYPPCGRSTYWAHAELRDDDGILAARWIEAIDPVPPECTAPTEELAAAAPEDLASLWGAEFEDEGDGHAWARPHALVGGSEANPGVILSKPIGVVIRQVCLRCGTLATIDTGATDPGTGEQGLESLEYEPGRYAAEVQRAAEWPTSVSLT